MQKVLPGPGLVLQASMKVPPKRKGNDYVWEQTADDIQPQ